MYPNSDPFLAWAKLNVYFIQGGLELDWTGQANRSGHRARIDPRSLMFVRDQLLSRLLEIKYGLLDLNVATKLPIVFLIESPGGETDAVFEVYDYIENLKSLGFKIYTVALHECASGGAYLLMAGSPGYRFAYPGSEIMVHLARIFTEDTDGCLNSSSKKYIVVNKIPASSKIQQLTEEDLDRLFREMKKKNQEGEEDFRRFLRRFKRTQQKLVDMIIKHCKNGDASLANEIRRDLVKNDLYLTAVQAKKWGIVDHIESPENIREIIGFFPKFPLSDPVSGPTFPKK